VMEAEESSAVYALRGYVIERFPEATSHHNDHPQIRQFLIDGINAGRVTPAMLFTAMVDLEILSDDNDFRSRAASGRFAANNLIIEKLQMGELTPQMINVDPSTGSVVVLCVRTGSVLAAVTYPSYDNNRLANRVDAEYYHRINALDPTHPMINRPFMEARAPGSTFKMITAVAGLETGVLTPTSTIRDRVVFTRAGHPPARCWASGGHGNINVSQAISISCNYFFFETSMRLGSNTTQRIETLNRYMEFFGLNERAGVEVGEVADTFTRTLTPNIMASPSRKQFNYLSRNEFAPRSQWGWTDGDTIRTSIGQSVNSYSTAMMAKYILQIANRGERLPLTLINTITSYSGEILHQVNPVPDYTGIIVSDSTWDVIHHGMIQTTEGWGTATTQFRGFPIRVAGKTGTAQEIDGRPDHQSFGGFAPIEDPQIAIYVMLPFGTTRQMPASATQVARDVIYAFLRPELTMERPVSTNAILR